MSEQQNQNQNQPQQIHPATIGLRIQSMVSALVEAIEKQGADIEKLVAKLKELENKEPNA